MTVPEPATGLPSPLPPLSPTPRSSPRRMPQNAATDRRELYELLDAGVVGHLGVVLDGAPVVLPTAYARAGDEIYLHGSTGSRSLRAASEGAPVCFTVTALDGLVYARSVFETSMNYRSAVVHGTARRLAGDEEEAALRVLVEHLTPGGWDHARRPSAKERAATAVLALPLAEAAVKRRAGGPDDDAADVAAGRAWAGVLPVVTTWGRPVPAEDLPDGTPVPAHVEARAGRRWS